MSDTRLGIISGLVAYLIWGGLTIYWHALAGVDPFGMIALRVAWSAVVLGILMTAGRRWPALWRLRHDRVVVGRVALAALMVTVNWTSYLWCVVHDNVVETALGYFLAPLGTVAAGVLVLHEHLRRAQAIALGLAAVAVAVITIGYGQVPTFALLIAGSWTLYGLIKKSVPLDGTESVTGEIILLLPIAIGFLVVTTLGGDPAWSGATSGQQVLLALSGIATALPLVLFGFAARRVPLTTLGPLMYVVPIINLLLGWLVYDEPMPPWRAAGFAVVWVALAMFTIDGLQASRAGEPSGPEPEAVPLEG